jgi:hypothetical protein
MSGSPRTGSVKHLTSRIANHRIQLKADHGCSPLAEGKAVAQNRKWSGLSANFWFLVVSVKS